MRALMVVCFLIAVVSLTGCGSRVDVAGKKNGEYFSLAQKELSQKSKNLIGTKWYAGRYADKFGFKRTQSAFIKKISLSDFKCKIERVGKWYSLERKTDCHAVATFEFEARNNKKYYKSLIKFKNVTKGFSLEKNYLSERLAVAFVKKNPFSKRAYSKYWNVLKRGKLAVGMPEDYLKICWGKPLRIFDKSIDATGSRETFVYDRYFVFLENGVVSSIHKFDS